MLETQSINALTNGIVRVHKYLERNR